MDKDKNKKALERFLDHLECARAETPSHRDIRDYVGSLSEHPVRIGFRRKNLDSAYASNLRLLFPNLLSVEEPEDAGASTALMSGVVDDDPSRSHQGGVQLLGTLADDAELLLVEQGFLASAYSWSHAFRENAQTHACLGYVYDDIAHYYMADYPNRLTQKLNSNQELSEQERTNARELIDRIVSRKISKYNAQPFEAPRVTEGYARRVLVCDQSYADASTTYGRMSNLDFEQMLLAAILENPDAEILVKSHPDTSWEPDKRKGYFSHLRSTGRVRILREPCNPYALFDLVDTVYVGTSQMGLEALFAGKKVVCFGVPFYAGWGLTDDRKLVAHRDRARTLEDIFHYFYVWYTIYQVPGCSIPSTAADALDYIEVHRPFSLPPTEQEVAQTPTVSVIVPVYNVEQYLEECLRSIMRQTFREIEIIVINDQSPDNSQDIVDRLVAEDPRIKPIMMKQNSGQGFARNAALDVARGEFVFFLDSDDALMDAHVIGDCVAAAQRTGADLVRVQKAVFKDGSPVDTAVIDRGEESFSVENTIENPLDEHWVLRSWHFWNYLYARRLIEDNEVRFKTRQWEERYFVCKALKHAKRLHIIPRPGVAYRVREGSTVRRQRTDADLEMMLAAIAEVGREFPKGATSTLLAIQFANFFIGGNFKWSVRLQKDLRSNNRVALDQVKSAFAEFEFDFESIANLAAIVLSGGDRVSSIALLLCAMKEDKWDLVLIAASQKEIRQKDLYTRLLTDSDILPGADVEAALNLYARNARVKASKRFTRAPKTLPRLVLHIGSTKTGSTEIQNHLETNRPALLREGIWYPEVGLFWQPSRLHKQAGHALFSQAAVRDDPTLRNYLMSGLATLDLDVHTIILSSEAFFLQAHSHEIVRYLSDFACEVVVYIRRQDEWANSQYCEFVGGGSTRRLDQSLATWIESEEAQALMDYRNVLERFHSVVPKDHIRVNVFDRRQLRDGDIIADFAETVGLPAIATLPRSTGASSNEARMSGAYIELLRLHNSRNFKNHDHYQRFIEDVGNELAKWRKSQGLEIPKPLLLSRDQRRALLERFRSSNQEIARDWLGSEDSALFDEDIPPASEADDVLYPPEISIVEDLCAKWSTKEVGTSVIVPESTKQSRARATPQKTLTEQYRVVNHGMFSWRLWGLTPLVRRQLRDRVSKDELAEFNKDPVGFLQSKKDPYFQRLTVRICPTTSVLGPGDVLGVWVMPMAAVARWLGGKKYEVGLRNNPVLFFRLLRNPVYRGAGRILFPIGEVRKRLD
ncbi:MAG: glycosyltransferase [Pseudomonadota bacterium]